ncbi:hypothetical protein L208DRAFT_1290457, partial [Tricholoma matsutake]
PNGATSNHNRSRTDPDTGGLQPDPLGPVLIGPWTKKRLIRTSFLSSLQNINLFMRILQMCLIITIRLILSWRSDGAMHKCFWSYLNQFLTVFDDPGTKSEVNMCGSKFQHTLGQKTSRNRF